MQELLGVAVRIGIMYLYSLALLRFAGKRTIGNLTPVDFLTALMLGDLFDNVIWAEVPVVKGIVAATVLIVLSFGLGYLEAHNDWLHRLLTSTPSLVVQQGAWVRAGMLRERENEEEIREGLRLRGVNHMGEVERGQIEPNGDISVQRFDAFQPAQQKDLPSLRKD